MHRSVFIGGELMFIVLLIFFILIRVFYHNEWINKYFVFVSMLLMSLSVLNIYNLGPSMLFTLICLLSCGVVRSETTYKYNLAKVIWKKPVILIVMILSFSITLIMLTRSDFEMYRQIDVDENTLFVWSMLTLIMTYIKKVRN